MRWSESFRASTKPIRRPPFKTRTPPRWCLAMRLMDVSTASVRSHVQVARQRARTRPVKAAASSEAPPRPRASARAGSRTHRSSIR
jgi:hypothetical protein